MPREKKYRYFTEVIAQRSPYIVKHKSKASQREYEQKLAKQHPYFRKVRSDKL